MKETDNNRYRSDTSVDVGCGLWKIDYLNICLFDFIYVDYGLFG